MVPAHTAIDVTRLLIGIAFAGAEKQTRGKELETNVARMKIEAESHLQELRINSQKDVFLALTALSKHAFDRKMDFFCSAFQSFIGLIKQQEATLSDELKEIRLRRVDSSLTTTDLIRLDKSATDIRNEQEKLRLLAATMTFEFNARVSSLSPELRIGLPKF